LSKWVNTFENHAFHTTWNTLKEEVERIDETEITDDNQLIELARIKKVIDYIDSYLKIVEPDLNVSNIATHLNHMNSYSGNFRNEVATFCNSKNTTNLTNANAHLDSLLGQVRGLNVGLPKLSGQSLSGMLKRYNNTLDTALKEINLATVTSDSNQIKNYKKELLDDTDERDSTKTEITTAYTDIIKKHKEIKEFYDETLNDTEYDNTLKALVIKAKDEVIEANESAQEELKELKLKIEKFEEYYVKVFGEPNEDDVRTGGLKSEIESQQKRLDTFEKEQEEKHNKILADKLEAIEKYEKETQLHNKNLHAQIESLLPGATSAGLAEAYHQERNKFDKPIKFWNKIFIGSLGLMFLGTFLTFSTFTSTETSWTFSFASHIKGIEDTLNNLFYKLPLYAPLIWLAIYASKRRSENQRLEQEYAHKEALARSYSSYKQQIEGLNQQDEALLKKLLESSIETVSYNASESLDKKHGDGTPSKEVLEKFGEVVKKVTGK
jgi:hypothetical protein